MNLEFISWEKTKHDNDKYFGYFDTKEEAEDWFIDQVNRYIYTPNPEKMSVSRICREAQDKGISLHKQTALRWFKEMNIKIRNARPKKKTHKKKTFSISKIVDGELEGYPNKSYLADLGLRLVLGIPTEDVVIILPDEEEGTITLIFRKKKKGRVQMWTSGDIDQKFEQQIRMLMQRVNQVGMKAVIEYAQTNGYAYYGGTLV